MKISLNWLKQYIDLPKDLTPEDLALKLTMSTVEVEEIIDQKEQYQNMVIGEITEILDHPNADKLKVCKVKAGREEFQVVCGGSNIYKGMKGVLAKIGAKVKWHGQGGLVTLEKAKIRGIESEGMLCAASEIGLADEFEEADGVLDIKDVKSGQLASEALGLNDIILDIDNKSITHRPDLWGHYGIAREVAAILNLKLKKLETVKEVKEGKEVDLKIEIKDKENCSRYLGAVVGGIKIGPSPAWMQNLLKAVGVRPINNIVDITNYVMLELGRPSHAFDRRDVAGDTIIVRNAKAGEKLKTLDGIDRTLTKEMCLVCDAKRPIDLGGIMGGENSEVKSDTAEIILELANFNPVNIRRTATALGLRTEAAARFEKSLDPSLAELGFKRILAFIQDLVPGAHLISKVVDANYDQDDKRVIDLDYQFLTRKIGVEIPKKEVVNILESLSFKVKENKEGFKVEPPSFRPAKDISIPEDLVEEVARIYGFGNIPEEMPQIYMEAPKDNAELKLARKLRTILTCGCQADEVYNHSFTGQKNLDLLGLDVDSHLQLLNYFSEEQKYLRTTLFENLIKNIEDNLRFYKEINLFEIGRVYLNEPGEYTADKNGKEFLNKQPKMLGGILTSDDKEIFYKAKGIVEIILNNLEIAYEYNQISSPIKWLAKDKYLEVMVGDEVVGWISTLPKYILGKTGIKQPVAVWQLNFKSLLKNAQDNIKFKKLPKFPGITYDLSIIVSKEAKWSEIRKNVLEVSGLIKRVQLFDIYEGKNLPEGKKSLAFHIYFLDEKKTLTSQEVDVLRDKAAQLLKKQYQAEVREQ